MAQAVRATWTMTHCCFLVRTLERQRVSICFQLSDHKSKGAIAHLFDLNQTVKGLHPRVHLFFRLSAKHKHAVAGRGDLEAVRVLWVLARLDRAVCNLEHLGNEERASRLLVLEQHPHIV